MNKTVNKQMIEIGSSCEQWSKKILFICRYSQKTKVTEIPGSLGLLYKQWDSFFIIWHGGQTIGGIKDLTITFEKK